MEDQTTQLNAVVLTLMEVQVQTTTERSTVDTSGRPNNTTECSTVDTNGRLNNTTERSTVDTNGR